MKRAWIAVAGALALVLTGCAPVLIGGGAVGGYKAATDERSAGTMWDDATISAKVKRGLIEHPEVRARKIDVDTVDGVVVLSGLVQSPGESERAVAVAQAVPGVKRVENNIQIGSRSLGRALDDQVLSSKIKAKLVNTPGIRALNVDVDVIKGVVTLGGKVETGAQKNQILEIARSVEGTVEVVDKLQVQQP